MGPVTVGLETDAVHGAVDFRYTEDLFNHLTQIIMFIQIDGFTTEAAGLLEPFLVQVADNDHRGAQQLRGMGGGQSNRTRTGDVYGRTGCHAGAVGTVVSGGEDVRQAPVRSRFFSMAWSLSGNLSSWKSA